MLLTHVALLAEFPDPGKHLFILGSSRCEVCGQQTDDGHQTAHVLQVPLVFICCQHCAHQTLKEDMNGLGMKKSVCTQPCQQCPTVTDLKAAADFSLCVDVSVPHDPHS